MESDVHPTAVAEGRASAASPLVRAKIQVPNFMWGPQGPIVTCQMMKAFPALFGFPMHVYWPCTGKGLIGIKFVFVFVFIFAIRIKCVFVFVFVFVFEFKLDSSL